ncbi:hypothetical protein [Tautonia sociabilis]|uniref:Uncharacterized protein n=1 Tax=Tautonia sociabilis TaxID=2080755 RepID=A0A432MEG8_9BACT|nr:hypothetical protein [Tautonia sociabilis]RUL83783.1 hypothetical protein TsocGM_21600 [Tautonia sociabilis]
MTAQASTRSRSPSRSSGSLSRVLLEATGLVLVLVGVGAWMHVIPEADPAPEATASAVAEDPEAPEIAEPRPAEEAPSPEPGPVDPAPEAVAVAVAPDPQPEPEPEPPGPDPEALAAAEAELQAAREALASAEAEEARLSSALEETELQVLAADREVMEAGQRARAEAERVAAARADVAALRAEVDRLSRVIAAIEAAPRPREALNSSQSPVAQVVSGEEYHFEVRGDRVAYIDLDRLLEQAQDDARLRLRMAGPSARTISGTVGPIGSFSLSYEVGPTGIGLVSELSGPAVAASYGLRGFEIVPVRSGRGEPFEVAFSPAAEFGRVIHRLNPNRTTITLWVYPDGFPLYRRLWDALHELGFTVAARPLPEGLPIRGGPNGSRSAGQ